MPRDLVASYAAELGSSIIRPVFFAQIQFKSKTEYVCTLGGSYLWNGQTWLGLGSVAGIGISMEDIEVNASGLTVTLSGISDDLLGESLADIQLLAPATVWVALMDENLNMIGTPAVYFGGIVGAPEVLMGTETSTIALQLETHMVRMQIGQHKRYTAADQRLIYPDDTGFNWVEQLNDLALRWGN
jgi:hypothetical protein